MTKFIAVALLVACFSTRSMALPQHPTDKPASGTAAQTSSTQSRAFLFRPNAGDDDEAAPPVPIHRAHAVGKKNGKRSSGKKKPSAARQQTLSGLLYDWFHV